MEEVNTDDPFKDIIKRDHVLPTKYSSDEVLISRRGGLIGRGAYSSVLQCYHENFKTTAVKCYCICGNNEEVNKKLKNAACETIILRKVSHKNIIQLYGYTSWKKYDENYHGIIMELCNESLDQFIQRRKNENPEIPWELRVRFVKEIVDVLKYLHHDDSTKSIIHGDLKPENILLTTDLTVKLTDFGSCEIEKAAGIDTISIDIRASKQCTLYYTAPEFLKDSSKKKCPMDMYSFSMVSYEIITLHKVYSDVLLGSDRIVEAIKNTNQRPDVGKFHEVFNRLTKSKHKKICKTLIELAQNCWSKFPKARPTASQVCRSLQKCVEEWEIKFSSDYGQFSQQKLEKDLPREEKVSLSEYCSNFSDEAGKGKLTSTKKKRSHFLPGMFNKFQKDMQEKHKDLQLRDFSKLRQDDRQFRASDELQETTQSNQDLLRSISRESLSENNTFVSETKTLQHETKQQEEQTPKPEISSSKSVSQLRLFFTELQSESEYQSKPNYDKSKRPYSFPNPRDARKFSKHINDDAKFPEKGKQNWKKGDTQTVVNKKVEPAQTTINPHPESSESIMEDSSSLDDYVIAPKINQEEQSKKAEPATDGQPTTSAIQKQGLPMIQHSDYDVNQRSLSLPNFDADDLFRKKPDIERKKIPSFKKNKIDLEKEKGSFTPIDQHKKVPSTNFVFPSTALGTKLLWRSLINLVLHVTDEELFDLAEQDEDILDLLLEFRSNKNYKFPRKKSEKAITLKISTKSSLLKLLNPIQKFATMFPNRKQRKNEAIDILASAILF